MKIFFTLLLCMVELLSFETLTFEKNNFHLTQENRLINRYPSEIEPYFNNVNLHYFKGEAGVDIAYKVFKVDGAKANIVISSGRTESMVKYQELIYDLTHNGFNVFIFDHRGQGLSGRTQDKDPQLGDVEEFEYYVEDLKTFMDEVVKKNSQQKRFLLSHSMGGTIGSLYLEKYHFDFSAAVFSSPMHQPSIGGSFTTGLVCGFYEKERKNRVDYVIGTSSYDSAARDKDYKIYTRSLRRYALIYDAYEQYPQAKIGGPSSRWVAQSCAYSKKSVQEAYKIQIPFLLFSAQSDDVVNEKAQEKFCSNASKFCKGYSVEDAEHEIFIERDEIRNSVLAKILNFFNANI